MARIQVWAGFHECMDVAALRGVAVALEEATEAAEALGCEARLGLEDVGEQQVVVQGTVEAIAAAVEEYSERGFEPAVRAEDEAVFAALETLLPDDVGLEVER